MNATLGAPREAVLIAVSKSGLAEGQTPETKVDKHSESMEGVYEIIDVEGDPEQTKDFRPAVVSEDPAQPRSSHSGAPLSHGVLLSPSIASNNASYWLPICHFTSAKQLLCALRDVVASENRPPITLTSIDQLTIMQRTESSSWKGASLSEISRAIISCLVSKERQ